MVVGVALVNPKPLGNPEIYRMIAQESYTSRMMVSHLFKKIVGKFHPHSYGKMELILAIF